MDFGTSNKYPLRGRHLEFPDKLLPDGMGGTSVSLNSQATDTLSALAEATTSISVTGRRPLSIFDTPDWSIFMPDTCSRVTIRSNYSLFSRNYAIIPIAAQKLGLHSPDAQRGAARCPRVGNCASAFVQQQKKVPSPHGGLILGFLGARAFGR